MGRKFFVPLKVQKLPEDKAHYPPIDPIQAGLKGCCPRCGQGKAFDGIITLKDQCNACGLNISNFEVGDGAAIFVIMIANFLVMGMALWVEFTFEPPLWVHAIIWLPVILAICIICIRVFKGMLLAQQFRKDATQGRMVSE